MKQSEIRKHYFLDRYVIFSPKRNLRPRSLTKEEAHKKSIGKEDCFFCPGNLETEITYQVGKGENWKVAVVKNKFPALTMENKKAFGTQEIVLDTPEHNKEISDLPIEHIVDILKTYNQRTEELKKIEGIKYVLVFKNDGGTAGASVPHAHSQIIALPIIPPKIMRESDAVDEYTLRKGSCPHCDIIEKEKDSPRVVYKDENIIAICPNASSSPHGVWIMPVKHIRNLNNFKEKEYVSLAKALKLITGKLDSDGISFNYFLNNSLDLESHHFKIKIVPRISIWAGLELGTGVVINPIFPEDSAKWYRS